MFVCTCLHPKTEELADDPSGDLTAYGPYAVPRGVVKPHFFDTSRRVVQTGFIEPIPAYVRNHGIINPSLAYYLKEVFRMFRAPTSPNFLEWVTRPPSRFRKRRDLSVFLSSGLVHIEADAGPNTGFELTYEAVKLALEMGATYRLFV